MNKNLKSLINLNIHNKILIKCKIKFNKNPQNNQKDLNQLNLIPHIDHMLPNNHKFQIKDKQDNK